MCSGNMNVHILLVVLCVRIHVYKLLLVPCPNLLLCILLVPQRVSAGGGGDHTLLCVDNYTSYSHFWYEEREREWQC